MDNGYRPSSTVASTLLEQLASLDWRDDTVALEATSRVLSAGATPRLLVEHEFAAWKRREHGPRMELLSRETPTHWKWFVGGHPKGPLLWIHEYKPSTMRRSGYAQSIHDHRYSFCSAIVRGGYVHRTFVVHEFRSWWSHGWA